MPVTPWRTAHPRRPNCPAPAPPTHAAWRISSSATRTFSRSCRTPWRPACAADCRTVRRGQTQLQSRAVPQQSRQRHRLHQQRHPGACLLREHRSDTPPGHRCRRTVEDRPLARVRRLYLCRAPRSRAASSKHLATIRRRMPTAIITIRPGNRLPGIPANQLKFGVYLQGDGQVDCRCHGHLRKQRLSCSVTRPISRRHCPAISP